MRILVRRVGAKRWRRFNYLAALFWLALIPIAIQQGWLGSVTFVAAISLYANVASHLAAARADGD